MINVEVVNLVKEVKAEFPKIPEILAAFFSVWNIILIIGIIGYRNGLNLDWIL